MDEFRPSYSYSDKRMQIEVYGGRGGVPPSGLHDIRSYSLSHASYQQQQQQQAKEMKFKRGKSIHGKPSSSSSSSKVGGWGLRDPELQRRKRVATYKAYSVETKVKGSIKKSFTWLKDMFYGWW